MFKPSAKEQLRLGLNAASQLRKRERVLSDSDWRVRTVRDIGNRLVATIPNDERRKMPWQFSFDVIDSKDVNAFALPGGPVFFYTGLLNKLKTEDEIAGIIGHELTHVRKEHWARDYAKSQQNQLGLLVLGSIFRVNRTVFEGANLIENLGLELPRSRKNEYEADWNGYEMMSNAGYNPQGMVDVFKLLQAQGGKMPEFFSDHPDDKNRIKRLEDRIRSDRGRFLAQRPLIH